MKAWRCCSKRLVVKFETGKNSLRLVFRSFSMSSGLRSAAFGCAVVPATSAFSVNSHNQESRGGSVRAVFDILCDDRIRTRSRVAAAHAATAFVAESEQTAEGAALPCDQGGLPILLRLLLCHRWLCSLHDHHRVLCTGRRLYRSMLGTAIAEAASFGGLFFFLSAVNRPPQSTPLALCMCGKSVSQAAAQITQQDHGFGWQEW